MINTSPPSFLPKRPKRAPGVKRLNNVPKMLAAGVVLLFFGGVIYTAIEKQKASQVQQKAEVASKKVTGSSAPGYLTRESHGVVSREEIAQKDETRQERKEAPQPVIVASDAGSDEAEKARVKAWASYYQQVDALAQQRAQMNLQAMRGGDAQSPTHTGGSDTQTQMPPVPTEKVGYSTGGTDPDGQTGKQAFLNTKGDLFGITEDLPGSVHGPKPFTIMEGTPIPGRLVDAGTSDSPGQMVAEIIRNVCDDMTGDILLIPQGTRIITKYDTAVSTGQERMGTIAQRLIFPDTSSRQIGSMQIADQAGMAGLKDQVNTHFWDKFWSTAVIALVGAGAQVAQPQQSALSGYSPTSVGIGSMTQGFSTLGQSIAQKNLSIPNTIELRAGLPLIVKPNHDITLSQYNDARGYTGNGGACS